MRRRLEDEGSAHRWLFRNGWCLAARAFWRLSGVASWWGRAGVHAHDEYRAGRIDRQRHLPGADRQEAGSGRPHDGKLHFSANDVIANAGVIVAGVLAAWTGTVP